MGAFPLRLSGLLLFSCALVAQAEAPPAPELAPPPMAGLDDEAREDVASDDLVERALAMLDAHAPRRVPQRHWNNGPRAVPKARGSAQARAQALGIGGHYSTKRLLWSRPGETLLEAVPGQRPSSLLWPVVGGKWGRGFGYTRKLRPELRHNGIDIGAPAGTPVRAAADGIVIYSDNTLSNLGNAVMVLHPGGWTTLYAHNSRTTVQPGWYVKRGERIALVGQTGAAWGPHLHFELRDNGRWRDPAPFIVGYRDESLNGPLVELAAGAREKTRDESEAGLGVANANANANPSPSPSPSPNPNPNANPSASPNPNPSPSPTEAAGLEPEPSSEPIALPFELGSLRVTRRLLRGELRPALPDERVLGRKFSNLLRPVRGSSEERGFEAHRHPALDLAGPATAPVRAAADGVIVYAGQGLGGGHTLVMLHRGGWLTVYGDVEVDGAAETGTRVLRGEWIARTHGDAPLRFEWIADGKAEDAAPVLVGE